MRIPGAVRGLMGWQALRRARALLPWPSLGRELARFGAAAVAGGLMMTNLLGSVAAISSEDAARVLAFGGTGGLLFAMSLGLDGALAPAARPGLQLTLVGPVSPGVVLLLQLGRLWCWIAAYLGAWAIGVLALARAPAVLVVRLPGIAAGLGGYAAAAVCLGGIAMATHHRVGPEGRRVAVWGLRASAILMTCGAGGCAVPLARLPGSFDALGLLVDVLGSPGRPFANLIAGEGGLLAWVVVAGLVPLLMGWLLRAAPATRAEDLMASAARAASRQAGRQRTSPSTVARPYHGFKPAGLGARALVWRHWVEFVMRLSTPGGCGLLLALGLAMMFVAQFAGGPQAAGVLHQRFAIVAPVLPTLVGLLLAQGPMYGFGREMAHRTWLVRYPLGPGRVLAASLVVPLSAAAFTYAALCVPFGNGGPTIFLLAVLSSLAGWLALAAVHVGRALLLCRAADADHPGATPPWAADAWGLGVPALAVAAGVAANAAAATPFTVAAAAGLPGLVLAGAIWPLAVRALRRLEAPGGGR